MNGENFDLASWSLRAFADDWGIIYAKPVEFRSWASLKNEKHCAHSTIDHDCDASYGFVFGARGGVRSKVWRFPNNSRYKMDDYCLARRTKSKFLRWTLFGQGSEVYRTSHFSCIILSWQIDRFEVLYCSVNSISVSITLAANNCEDSSIDRVDIKSEVELRRITCNWIIYPFPIITMH